MRTIAFFNNKGGVGKTSLAYHLAWMYAQMGVKVVAADLDPQSNLTSMFLTEERLQELWLDEGNSQTILSAIKPLLKGIGDIADPHVEQIEDTENIGLLVGDLGLSSFEDDLASSWLQCLNRNERAFRVTSAFYRLMDKAANMQGAELVIIDVGPNLGAINRAALIAADYVIVPLAPDLFSLQGLRNLGPTLIEWRKQWVDRLNLNPEPTLLLPTNNSMQPAGYIILQYAVRLDRPAKAYDAWMNRFPSEYRESVLNEANVKNTPLAKDDKYCLAMLKNYRSLMPLAMEAHKPMFLLRAADGAFGAHAKAVTEAYREFKGVATKIAENCQIELPI
jgi:cellulose biosynthesis protein BcsQ